MVSMKRMVHDGTRCSYKDAFSLCVRGECRVSARAGGGAQGRAPPQGVGFLGLLGGLMASQKLSMQSVGISAWSRAGMITSLCQGFSDWSAFRAPGELEGPTSEVLIL